MFSGKILFIHITSAQYNYLAFNKYIRRYVYQYMATVEELLGFDEVCYLYDAYTDSLETNETYGEVVEGILRAFPGGLKTALPSFAKEKLFYVLDDLGRLGSFGDYAVCGKLYVYQTPELNGKSYKPVNRISFDTYIYKKPLEISNKKNMIKPIDSLMFHATVRGGNLSKEPGEVQYLPGCSAEVWQLHIPDKKKFEPVAFEEGIYCLEKI